MTDRLEDLVRDVMRASAAGASTPPDLAERALARRSARRVRRAVMVGVTALATVTAAILVPFALARSHGTPSVTALRTNMLSSNPLGAGSLQDLGNESVKGVALSSYVAKEADGLLHAYVRNPTDGTFRRTDDSWALVSPDGDTAAVLQNSYSTQLQIMDTRTGQVIASYQMPGSSVSTPYWSTDGSALVLTVWGPSGAGGGPRQPAGFAVFHVASGMVDPWHQLGTGSTSGKLPARSLDVHWETGAPGVVSTLECGYAVGPGACAEVEVYDLGGSLVRTVGMPATQPSASSTGSPGSTGSASAPPTAWPDIELPQTAYSVFSPDGTRLLAENAAQQGVVYDAATGSSVGGALPQPLGWADDQHVIATRTMPDTQRPQVVLVDLAGAVTQVLYTGRDGDVLPELFFTPAG